MSHRSLLCIVISSLLLPLALQSSQENNISLPNETSEATSIIQQSADPIITDILFVGNRQISPAALQAKVPFHRGERYDALQVNKIIKGIYALGSFKPSIKVYLDYQDADHAQLIVEVEEKDVIDTIIYKGNDNFKEDDLEKELHLRDKKTIDPAELQAIADKIKKLYISKDYHHAQVNVELEPLSPGKVNVVFTIVEGPVSKIARVLFVGNNSVPSKQLRNLIFTREDWLFGFIRRNGSLQPEALDYDKHVLENFYQSNGFYSARVTNVDVQEDECNKFTVTFTINEGDIYTIEDIQAEGNDVLNEAEILARIPLVRGELYSRERIRMAMERLRLVWGEFGYVYAEVNPSVIPHPERKTVSLMFYTELGNAITVNRISIVGNKKTRDYVIRRQIIFNEGELLTTFKMDESKRRIDQLGYFDPKAGVNWRIIKIDENTADLELIVKEIKTGQMYSQVGFGGLGTTDQKRTDVESERRDDAEAKESPSHSFKIGLGIKDNNLLGTGILWNVSGTYSEQEMNALVNISNPWLMNRPISGGLDLAARQVKYDEFFNVDRIPVERSETLLANIGWRVKQLGNALSVIDSGFEHIKFENRPQAMIPNGFQEFRADFQRVLDQRFRSGTIIWLGLNLAQDMRNHPMFPTNGYQWGFNARFALPHSSDNFAFFKTEVDFRWYTPIIEQYDLVFHMHGHAGYIKPFPNSAVPYRELFNVGGPTTVRGFLFGQIGPNLIINPSFGSSAIGATKEFFINVELQFPIKLDMSLRGIIFYDGGAGWDTPDAQCINPLILRNNNFNYRHSIGLGVRMTYPTPVRIDWGFKLDRNKRRGESASEMHFTALQEF